MDGWLLGRAFCWRITFAVNAGVVLCFRHSGEVGVLLGGCGLGGLVGCRVYGGGLDGAIVLTEGRAGTCFAVRVPRLWGASPWLGARGAGRWGQPMRRWASTGGVLGGPCISVPLSDWAVRRATAGWRRRVGLCDGLAGLFAEPLGSDGKTFSASGEGSARFGPGAGPWQPARHFCAGGGRAFDWVGAGSCSCQDRVRFWIAPGGGCIILAGPCAPTPSRQGSLSRPAHGPYSHGQDRRYPGRSDPPARGLDPRPERREQPQPPPPGPA
mgnify:FL=1